MLVHILVNVVLLPVALLLQLAQPLTDLVGVIKRIYPVTRTWEILFSLDGVGDCFSKPVAKRAERYLQAFRDRAGVFDLDPLPDGRPRYAAAGRPLFGLTAHMRMVWSPAADLCLRRSELAAAMGVPCHPALSISYGLLPLSLSIYLGAPLQGSSGTGCASLALAPSCTGALFSACLM